MLPLRIVSKFMRFPFVIDMYMAGDQCQRHNFCVSDVTKSRYLRYQNNVIYRFAPMDRASCEQEYRAKALEINVLTLTMAK